MITPHQRTVLSYIRNFQQKRRYSPSLAELCDAFGVRSRNSMAKVIATLRYEKLIELNIRGRILFPYGTIVPEATEE